MEVTIIEKKNDTVLVEWVDDGQTYRATFPSAVVNGTTIEDELIGLGFPYGEDWVSRIGDIHISAKAIAEELRKNHIWTREDAQKESARVRHTLEKFMTNAFTKIVR